MTKREIIKSIQRMLTEYPALEFTNANWRVIIEDYYVKEPKSRRFKVGDVVHIKGFSQKFVIDEVDGADCTLVWYLEGSNSVYYEYEVNMKILELIEEY